MTVSKFAALLRNLWTTAFRLPVRGRANRVLLNIKHRTCDALTFIARKIKRRERYIARKQQPPKRSSSHRFFYPLFTFAFVVFIAMFGRRKRPPSINLIHANAIAVEVTRAILRQRH